MSFQETESQATFAIARSYQLTASNTGSEPPAGSDLRTRASALLGLPGSGPRWRRMPFTQLPSASGRIGPLSPETAVAASGEASTGDTTEVRTVEVRHPTYRARPSVRSVASSARLEPAWGSDSTKCRPG